MATANLSNYNKEDVPNGASFSIGIVVAKWNNQITNGLFQGALKTLLDHGVSEAKIHVHSVPGAFELPLGAQWLASKDHMDAVIAIGSVIQGETKHFDFVCEGVTIGLTNVSLKYNKPVVFCVLTDNTLQQAKDRSGGAKGNKGVEAAVTALQMLGLRNKLLV